MNSLLQANLDAAQARIQEPKTGADLGERPTEAVRSRTAGQQNQCFEQRCLKRQPAAQRGNAYSAETPLRLRPAMSATQSTRLRTMMAQSPPTRANHWCENRTGSPAASGRTARHSAGVARAANSHRMNLSTAIAEQR